MSAIRSRLPGEEEHPLWTEQEIIWLKPFKVGLFLGFVLGALVVRVFL